jgi:hypothetical protein
MKYSMQDYLEPLDPSIRAHAAAKPIGAGGDLIREFIQQQYQLGELLRQMDSTLDRLNFWLEMSDYGKSARRVDAKSAPGAHNAYR